MRAVHLGIAFVRRDSVVVLNVRGHESVVVLWHARHTERVRLLVLNVLVLVLLMRYRSKVVSGVSSVRMVEDRHGLPTTRRIHCGGSCGSCKWWC